MPMREGLRGDFLCLRKDGVLTNKNVHQSIALESQIALTIQGDSRFKKPWLCIAYLNIWGYPQCLLSRRTLLIIGITGLFLNGYV